MADTTPRQKRQRYWDYPSKTTLTDLFETDCEDDCDGDCEDNCESCLAHDGSMPVVWDNKEMRGWRRDGLVLAYTLHGQPGELVMFDWPDEQTAGKVAGNVLGKGARLDVKTTAQLREMCLAWFRAGEPETAGGVR